MKSARTAPEQKTPGTSTAEEGAASADGASADGTASSVPTTMSEFRLGITDLLGRVMPVPVILVSSVVWWRSETRVTAALAVVFYSVGNVLLDAWVRHRSGRGEEIDYLFGPTRIALNSVATACVVYSGGASGQGWIVVVPLLCVLGHMPGVSAWLGNVLVVLSTLGAYWMVGASITDLLTASALLGSISLLSTPVVTQFRNLWDRAVAAGEALEVANQELRSQKSQLEILLREAKQAAIAKDRFLANMSHEMRTPLNGILGVISLLRSGGLEGEQRDLVEIASQSANDLLSEVNDVLDLTKLESGRMQIESEPFDLKLELEKLVAEFRFHQSAAGKEFKFEAAGAVPRWVIGDCTRLRQVVRNLLSNAFKFSKPKGHVQLLLDVFPSETQGKARLRLRVVDDGIGIPQDAQQRIFDRFEQVDASTTRKYGGTGLGLAICRQLVHAMGGKIGLESELDRGSTFWVDLELPCSGDEVPAAVAAVPNTEPVQLSGRRVLLVEDLRINQIVGSRLLQKLGCEVELAANGLEALDALGRQHFHAVLMDCQMPEMDGYEATRALRELEARTAGLRTPVIALTAAVTPADRERCVQAGMDGFISKPIREGELERVLGGIFQRSAAPGAGRGKS